MPDAPVEGGWLLNQFGGGFSLLAIEAELPEGLPGALDVVRVTRDAARKPKGGSVLVDAEGLAAQRYGAGTTYLIRPDQHVAARFAGPTAADIKLALARASGSAT